MKREKLIYRNTTPSPCSGKDNNNINKRLEFQSQTIGEL